MARFRGGLVATAVGVLALAGCGGGESGPDSSGGQEADAGPQGESADAAPANPCTVAGALGALGALENPQAFRVNQRGSMGTRKIHRLYADIETGPPLDQAFLELWDEYGVFGNKAATTGTFEIAGDELSLDTCGVCLQIYGDFDPQWGPTKVFLAQSGTVAIDSLTDTLSGSLKDVTFAEIDPQSGELVPDGCTTSLDSATFSAAIQAMDGGGGDGSGGGGGTGGGGGGG